MHKKGFTLVEIVIVVFIFGVGILTTLNALSINLRTFDTTKIEQQASLLANEGMQLFFHYRDNNIHQGFPRNYFTTQNGVDVFFGEDQAKIFQIGLNPHQNEFEGITLKANTDPKPSDFFEALELYQINFFSGDQFSWYGHEGDSTLSKELPVKFARYLSLTGIVEDQNKIPEGHILKIESHVLFQKGAKTGEVILESFIGNKGF